MTVYLLHIDPPLKSARHYIGFCHGTMMVHVLERLKRHQTGRGGALPREAVLRGSTISLVHAWLGADRDFERRVKGHGGAGRWCPGCARGERRMPQPDIVPARRGRYRRDIVVAAT